MISPAELDRAQALVACGLLGLAIAWLPRVSRRVLEVWRPAPARDRALLLVAIALAAVLRWLVAPLELATVFIGYIRTSEAIDLLPIAHYGAGSMALYHTVFQLFPADHLTLMATNAALAVLALPLIATVAATLLRDTRAGALAALLIALTPLFVRNDTSDANVIPCLLWLFAGLTLWLEHLARPAPAALAGAVVFCALAAIGRPEFPLVVATTLLAFAWATPGGLPRLRTRPVLLAALAGAALITPHALHILNAIGWLEASDALPGYSADRYSDLWRLFFGRNVLFRPDLFPVVATALAVAAPLLPRPQGRRGPLALALIAAIVLTAYAVDLDESNIARVHAPVALFATLLAAATLSWLLAAPRLRALTLLTAAALIASALPTAPRLWTPTNEAQEDAFIRQLPAHLPDTPHILVVRGRGDVDPARPDDRYTHLYFPGYLFQPPAGQTQIRSIDSWLDAPRWDVPAYFYQGFRCYAAFRPDQQPTPHGDNLHPSCRRLQQSATLEPVLHASQPNHGDPWIHYYGDAPTLPIGLFRIQAPARDGGSAPAPAAGFGSREE